MCSRAFVTALEDFTANGGFGVSVCMHFVRGIGRDGLRPDVCHVVLTWEGAEGIRRSTLRCMCGQVENPYL